VTLFPSLAKSPISRRQFLSTSVLATAGTALYAGEIERHWIQVTRHEVPLPGLHAAFNGMRIVQISDIHMNEFTEPLFLREGIRQVNGMNADAIFITGDFVTFGAKVHKFAKAAAWQCAEILRELQCKSIYAVLGNHDMGGFGREVTRALTASGIMVLNNSHVALERGGARVWLAGVEDPYAGEPNPEAAIPKSIRNVPGEPVILLCHGPDYANELLAQPAGQAVSLMLSGHTHGGQIRLPYFGPLRLPPMGQEYVEGWFKLGAMQLYVNRGLGTVGLPFRFNCPPEISLLTLRA